ncbi:MAG: GtrA family protein [Halomonas sp.]|uniref:GtrA family protein n=1 Tax=Halomonas sp. TaxID=1486246 RepID=UPI003F93622D
MINSLSHRFYALRSELGRILRFCVVGGLATLVHIGLAGLLLAAWLTGPIFIINLLAYLGAFTCSLIGHQRFTFGQRAHFLRFILMSLSGFAVNNLVLACGLWLGFSPFWAITSATGLAAAVSYLISRRWVFIN